MLQSKAQPAAVHFAAPFGTEGQARPQLVQFVGSSSSFTQKPLQGEYVSSQSMSQEPSLQTAAPWAGIGHAMPHIPQFAASLSVFTQRPLHAIVPLGQLVPQTPIVQTSFSAHGESQPPQWAALTWVSMHELPHLAKPSPQLYVHTPSEQVAAPFVGASHALPQAPQFPTLSRVLRQRVPSSHGVNPSSHSMAQAPPEHMLRPFTGLGHGLPHSPQ
jgi:hypothetical protein